MMIVVAIAVGLILAIGVFFVVMRGGTSTDPMQSKREDHRSQQRMNQARETDSSEDDEGPPGSETISQWSDSL